MKSTGPCCQEVRGSLTAHDTWSFKTGWQNNIDTPGVKQVTIWKDFFTSLPGQDPVPDQDHSVVTAGFGTYGDIKQTQVSKSDYATTSKTPDGAFVVAYMPAARTITVNMASLKANASAKWFDPTNGSSTPYRASHLPIPEHGSSHHPATITTAKATGSCYWMLRSDQNRRSRPHVFVSAGPCTNHRHRP